MSKRFSKVIPIILVLSMILSLSFTLFACTKKDPPPSIDEQYETAQTELKASIMSAKRSDWGNSLSNEQLANINDSGEYILYDRGTDFLISTLRAANILPVQMDSLTTLFKKEEVKKLFVETTNEQTKEENNKNFLKVLLPMLRDDFTSTDISNILYQLIYGFADQVDDIFRDVYSRGFDVYNLMDPSKPNRQLLGVAQISLNIFQYFDTTKTNKLKEKETLLTNITNAKPGIFALGDFAYNVSFTSIYDNFLVNVSENGALQDITQNEIKQTLVSLLDNFKSLKTALNSEQLNYLNIAFEAILSNFSSILLNDGIISSISNILSSLISNISTVYFSIDFLPYLCDAVISSEKLITEDKAFLDQVYNFITNKNYNVEVNKHILLSKVFINAVESSCDGTLVGVENKGKEIFTNIFNKIDAIEGKGMKLDKQVGVMGLDLMATLYRMRDDNKSSGEISEKRKEMLIPVMTYGQYKILKVDYEGAKAGIVVGDNPEALPFHALLTKFNRYSASLLNPLNINPKDWPAYDSTEEEIKAFFAGVLAQVEQYSNNIYDYMEGWYLGAKRDVLGDISYFVNQKYQLIKDLSGFTLIEGKAGYENEKEYKDVLMLVQKININFENPLN